MLSYNFMQKAFIAGTLIAVICGIVSFFVVLRRISFAAHSLGHISFTGASGAALFGFSPMSGELLVNIIAAIMMSIMESKIKKNDISIGIVLTFFLGVGTYFIYLYQNNYSGSIVSILFGNIFVVSYEQIIILLTMAFTIIIILAFISKALFLASIDPLIARAKNIPSRYLSIIFFIILSLTVTMACQIVGVLLVFSLLVGPAACAFQWGDGFYQNMILSLTTSIISVWLSLFLSFYFNLPVSFCITLVICTFYIFGLIKHHIFN